MTLPSCVAAAVWVVWVVSYLPGFVSLVLSTSCKKATSTLPLPCTIRNSALVKMRLTLDSAPRPTRGVPNFCTEGFRHGVSQALSFHFLLNYCVVSHLRSRTAYEPCPHCTITGRLLLSFAVLTACTPGASAVVPRTEVACADASNTESATCTALGTTLNKACVFGAFTDSDSDVPNVCKEGRLDLQTQLLDRCTVATHCKLCPWLIAGFTPLDCRPLIRIPARACVQVKVARVRDIPACVVDLNCTFIRGPRWWMTVGAVLRAEMA